MAGVVARVPAQEIEDAVKTAVLVVAQADPNTAVTTPEQSWTDLIKRVEVQANQLSITLITADHHSETVQWPESTAPQVLAVPWSKPPMRRRRELVAPTDEALQQRPIRSEARSRLLKAIAQGRMWLDLLIQDHETNMVMIAKNNHLSEKSVRATVSLAFLAPDIVEAAIDGRLHRGLTSTHMTGLPTDWQEQRQVLGLS